MSELKINDKYYDLEALIREGIDNRTSIIVEFPDGRKAEVLIKPVSIEEYKPYTIPIKNFDINIWNG